MLVLLIGHLAAAVSAPLLVRWWGRRACYLLAVAPAAAFGWAVTAIPTILRGEALVETYPWIGQLRLDLALRVGPLSWLMVLLVGGIGALALVYSAGYLPADEPGLGRYAATFVGFAGAMLGLVMADDLVLLYVFWELTSVFSYLLIGHHPQRRANRRAAAQALVVTTTGGLAMFVGFLMLGHHTGTYRWSQIMAEPPSPGAYLTTAVLLILAGALAKSAIFPVSFWLPAAMAAPTPVSAYLHAAAMVKAGVYLVALLAPVLAATAGWHPVLYLAGSVTMLVGGWAALRQTDLKLLLAYGTVSQLGLLTVLTAAGTHDAALAATAMLLAHALFKAALFLVVGIVDHRAGSRDLTVLSGLWRRMPLVAAAAALAAASMAGLPPTLGFVAKEAVFAAFADQPLLLATLLVGTTLTVAYSLRFLWGAFADKPGRVPAPAPAAGVVLSVPVGLLALASLAAGPLAGTLHPLLARYAGLFPATDQHLALWHGPTVELGLSALVLAGGGLLVLLRRRFGPAMDRLRAPVDGSDGYEWLTRRLDRLAVRLTGLLQRGSLPQYLGTILVVLAVTLGGALAVGRPWPQRVIGWHTTLHLVVGLVLVSSALLAVWARRRIAATVLVGVTGYSCALLFVGYGALDLALTQVLVETVTILGFVLVLRRLPVRFSARPLRLSRWGRAAIGTAVGLVMAGLTFAASGGRRAPPISTEYPDLATSHDRGNNVVNVTLVDIRGWDTLGETSVLVVAATGVAGLIFVYPRRGRGSRQRVVETVGDRTQRGWLRSGPYRGSTSRTIVFEVVIRLLFHTMVLFSIHLMFSGHNGSGGGFAGGLAAGLAIAVRYLAGGRDELDQAVPVDAGLVLGVGLFLVVGSGVVPLLFGGAALQSVVVDLRLPLIGELHLITSIFFDIGVYLIVIGLMLDILRSLGAEVDRQIEAGGVTSRRADLESPGGAGETRRMP